jgi:hypothetical protein
LRINLLVLTYVTKIENGLYMVVLEEPYSLDQFVRNRTDVLSYYDLDECLESCTFVQWHRKLADKDHTLLVQLCSS